MLIIMFDVKIRIGIEVVILPLVKLKGQMVLLARFRCKTITCSSLLKLFDAEQFVLLELRAILFRPEV